MFRLQSLLKTLKPVISNTQAALCWSSSNCGFTPDLAYLAQAENHPEILQNIELRQSKIDLDRVDEILKQVSAKIPVSENDLFQLPNRLHPSCKALAGQEAKILTEKFGMGQTIKEELIADAEKIQELLQGFRSSDLEHISGPGAYYLIQLLALLESSLIDFIVHRLTNLFDFELVSLPDLLPAEYTESSAPSQDFLGLELRGENGTWPAVANAAEIALAALHKDARRPSKVCAVSHGLSAESSLRPLSAARSPRVEMFSACDAAASDAAHAGLLSAAEDVCSSLDLDYRVVEAPPAQLPGPAAARAWLVEAALPASGGRVRVASASHCTDYHARRWRMRDARGQVAHTVSGVAGCVPSLIAAVLEHYHRGHGRVLVPVRLMSFMGRSELGPPLKSADLKMKVNRPHDWYSRKTVHI